MPTLFLVATPIGNLEDFSPRAQRILSEVQLIAAEDTRHSRKLLSHFGIQTPLTSYFAHNERVKLDKIMETLAQGDVALISDAGMPGINDPGYLLVQAALQAGHTVSPVPGPSAPVAALAASGLPSDQFLYLGYPARKAGERRQEFESVAALPYTLVFLESPHRLLATLQDLLATFGDRQVVVAAEISKLYERFWRGPLSEAVSVFAQEPARGEFTLVVAGATAGSETWDEARVRVALQAASDEPPSSLARRVAVQAGWPRSKVYDLLRSLQDD